MKPPTAIAKDTWSTKSDCEFEKNIRYTDVLMLELTTIH